jgi:hypothetical protein
MKRITKHVYDNEEKFRKAMKRMRLGCEEIDWNIEHEKSHYDKARELGYFPKYRIVITRRYVLGFRLARGVSIQTLVEPTPSKKDAGRIALAPRFPSRRDLMIAWDAGYCGEALIKSMEMGR